MNSDINSDMFWDRLKEAIGPRSNRSVGEQCGLSEGTIRRYLRKETYPSLDKIRAIAEVTMVNSNWLLTGEGPMRPGEAGPAQKEEAWSTGDWEQADVNIQQLLNMTAEILVSETVYRPALAANIKAFRRSIDLEKSNVDLQTRIDTLEDRLAALEQRLEIPKKTANGAS